MPSPRYFLALMLLASIPVHAAESQMFDKMKTYCFGRYLVDVPYEAELKGQGNNYYATPIQSGMGVANFRKQIEMALEKRKNSNRRLKFERMEFSENSDKQLVLSKADLWGDTAYAIDAFAMSQKGKSGGGYFFFMTGEGFDDKGIDGIVSDYRRILSSIRYRSDREIPKEPGFCIENGFIANEGKTPQFERASITFSLKKNPDVWFSVESFVLSKSQSSLLARIKESKVDSRFPGKIKRAREGRLDINGMEGEESLVHFPSDDKTGEAHSFTWETQGEVGNPIKPNIELTITSGEGVAGVTGASSMSTKQIQALYEAIVKTIRLRPTTEAR